MNPRYHSVSRRANHRCEYCRAPESIFNFAFEVEHIIPSAHGGTDDEANLALACRSCNLYKSDFLTGDDEATQREERLFHPREDSWEEHFQVDRETGFISGLTATGRATVARLNMNSEDQWTARHQWMRLGIFP